MASTVGLDAGARHTQYGVFVYTETHAIDIGIDKIKRVAVGCTDLKRREHCLVLIKLGGPCEVAGRFKQEISEMHSWNQTRMERVQPKLVMVLLIEEIKETSVVVTW